MLTIRIPYSSLWLMIQEIPDSTSEAKPLPRRSNTFTPIRLHPGAIPRYRPPEAAPLPPMIPEMCVPCPQSS